MSSEFKYPWFENISFEQYELNKDQRLRIEEIEAAGIYVFRLLIPNAYPGPFAADQAWRVISKRELEIEASHILGSIESKPLIMVLGEDSIVKKLVIPGYPDTLKKAPERGYFVGRYL